MQRNQKGRGIYGAVFMMDKKIFVLTDVTERTFGSVSWFYSKRRMTGARENHIYLLEIGDSWMVKTV